MENNSRSFIKERVSIKIAIIYAVFSALWILFSDQLLFFLIKNPESITKIQTIKGWVFILASALIIFFLLQREIQKYLQTESALRESEKKLQAIFNHRFQLTGLLDVNGRLIMANEIVCKIAGVDCSELVGKYIWELPHWSHSKEQQLKIQNSIQKVKKGNPINFETTHVDAKGEIKYIEFSLTPVHDDNGDMVYIVPEGKDITGKKQSEKKLIESERNYREIYNSSSDAIILHDVETGKIMDVNQTMLDMYGYTHHEVLEFNVGDISSSVDPYTQEEATKKLKKAIEEGPQLFEWIARHKNGSCFSVEVALRNTEIGGKGRVLAVVRDISERVQYETEQKKLGKKLQQAQKMEAIGTLAGGIAHDFNNILSSILGYTELVKMDVPKDSKTASYINRIMKASRRAGELVKQILTFSRKQDQELKPLKVNLVINEALKLLRSSIPSNIEIKSDIDRDCGLVLADPTRIHQVIMNLGTNAYHAMKKSGGQLSVSLKPFSVASMDNLPEGIFLESGEYLELIVKDNGGGIPEEFLEKIFEPYFTTKEKGEGTGLGLAIVHGIVKDFNGEIQLKSRIGKGTTFFIFLPLLTETGVVDNPENESVFLPRGQERILFVDDEKDVVDFSKIMLEELGYKITAFTNSFKAFDAFKNAPDDFDMVITDMTMPNKSGEQLSRQILEIKPGKPIILCTGFANRLTPDQVREIGIQGYIEKPILKKDLSIKIRHILDKKN